MNFEPLIPGIQFVAKYQLSVREIEFLILFSEKDFTILELAEKKHLTLATTRRTIQTLRFRGLIVLKDRNKNSECSYGLNLEKS